MKIISYYRVSTKKQGASGLGIEAQRASVEAWAANSEHEIIAEYSENESGSHDDRPELQKAMQQAAKTGATLVIAKLDRLSRNVGFLMQINELVNQGRLKVQALDLPQFNTLTVGIIATMAQYEREQASIRTKAALKAKKARGEKHGRTFTDEERNAATAAKREQHKNSPANIRAWAVAEIYLRDNGGNYSATAKALNKIGITTARGGQWQGVQVQRLQALMTGEATTGSKKKARAKQRAKDITARINATWNK